MLSLLYTLVNFTLLLGESGGISVFIYLGNMAYFAEKVDLELIGTVQIIRANTVSQNSI